MLDELGYYTCNGIRFESKIKAMIYANPLKLPIKWHFHDDAFMKHHWHVEPTQTLDELYDARARQIREQYDYVALSFSGGADTNNILHSFIRQGLHIDEIVSNWALDISEKYIDTSGKDRSPHNNNAEYFLNTRHRLQYVKDNCPRTKITVNDTSKAILDSLITKEDPSWVEARNDALNVTGAMNFNMPYFKDIRKMLDKQKSVAFVLGIDKPRLRIIDGKLYLVFVDKTVNMIPMEVHLGEYDNAKPVFFYWHADCVDLITKQAHTVLKYINTNANIKKIWEMRGPAIERRTQEELLRHMLYPSTWSADYWQAQKNTKDWDAELDYWFTRGRGDTREFQLWKNGLASLVPKIDSFLVRDPIDKTIIGTIPYSSQLYYIGDVL